MDVGTDRFLRALSWGVILLTIAIFGAIVTLLSFQFRGQIRSQIIARDAEVLYPVALLELEKAEEGMVTDFLGDPLFDEEALLLDVVLKTSQLKGVFGVRLFDSLGQFSVAVPGSFLEGGLDERDLETLRGLQPVSRFEADGRLGDYFTDPVADLDSKPYALLEVSIPLHRAETGELLGLAQYLVDGEKIKDEFDVLDGNLRRFAGFAFGSSSLIIGAVLLWAFRRLNDKNRLLKERGRKLAEANAELTLAAKSSAIGAVSAHLIHGLKNPLSGLQSFVSDRDHDDDERGEDEWELAVETTRRMQTMIEEIVAVLREEEVASEYDFTLEEIVDLISAKASPVAEKKRVSLEYDGPREGSIDSRRGNLLLLILMNLIQNAIEASEPEGVVRLSTKGDENLTEFRVIDGGAGIPETIRQNLFSPTKSSKEGGSGIGLAISQQLANHIGAELDLEKSDGSGSCFRVRLNLESV